MQRGEVRDPIMVMVLSLVTCGIYQLYWISKSYEELNRGLGREQFNFVKDLLLSVVTCGIYGIYAMWQFLNGVTELQQKWGVQPKFEAPIMFIVLFVFGPAVTFMAQDSLNNAWEHGTPGGAGGYSAGDGF